METVLKAEKSTPMPLIKHFLSEPIRARWELFAYYQFMKSHDFVKGDGHTILVIPGLLGADGHTKLLRKFLHRSGYEVMGWGLGTNYGDIRDLDRLNDLVQKIYRSSQNEITIVGISLGGIYARQLAKSHSEKVRQVFTMGSPFAGNLDGGSRVLKVYKLLKSLKGFPDIDPKLIENSSRPTSVPSVAFYTKQDGIVHWSTCKDSIEGDTTKNIEVKGSHFGLAHNTQILKIISDSLVTQK